jgi:hypothetical protein
MFLEWDLLSSVYVQVKDEIEQRILDNGKWVMELIYNEH